MQLVQRIKRKVQRKILSAIEYLCAKAEYLQSPLASTENNSKRLGIPWHRDNTYDNPSNIAIFVAFSEEITSSHIHYVSALKSAGFAVLFINNKSTLLGDRPKIINTCWLAFDRANIGRDFGAYKDGILLLESEGFLASCDYLCLANDSTQFVPGRNGKAFTKRLRHFIASGQDGLFSHESNQIRSHYQSYFQVISSSVFLGRAFVRFWHSYKPLNHRGHCIHNGEIKLSNSCYSKLGTVEVLYSSDKLLQALKQKVDTGCALPVRQLLSLMPLPTVHIKQNLSRHSLSYLLKEAEANARLDALSLSHLGEMLENILCNPSHMAAFLYPYLLNCPLVKNDICISGSFSRGMAITLFAGLVNASLSAEASSEEEASVLIKEFESILRLKGVASHFLGKS